MLRFEILQNRHGLVPERKKIGQPMGGEFEDNRIIILGLVIGCNNPIAIEFYLFLFCEKSDIPQSFAIKCSRTKKSGRDSNVSL
jgi:hypothetical protein